MDKRTSERMGRLAAHVLKKGEATPHEAKRLAGCVLAQVSTAKTAKRR